MFLWESKKYTNIKSFSCGGNRAAVECVCLGGCRFKDQLEAETHCRALRKGAALLGLHVDTDDIQNSTFS